MRARTLDLLTASQAGSYAVEAFNADNLRFSTDMATLAHTHNAAIKAELGQISGTEDDLVIAENDAPMTDPTQAAECVALSGVDALAVCVGNVHGHYQGEPRLDFSRLAEIRRRVSIPLMLHEASGLAAHSIQEAIAPGICKFNVNTEVRQSYLKVAHSAFNTAKLPELTDVMAAVAAAMQQVIIVKIRLFASSGKFTGS